jgi:hypothetical protein
MKTLSLLAALCVVWAPLAIGQDVSGNSPISLAAPPTYAGVYDVATGVFTTTPPPPAGLATVYDNSAGNGSFFTPGPGTIQMDWGTLSAGGHNDITEFDIGYATSDTNPVSITVYIHEGATGFGNSGTAITQIALSGLPGSASGSPEGFVVGITLASAIKVLDGAIGFSYEMFDTVTGPLLIGPPNEAGVVDAFDQYDTSFNIIGTFFFGGTPFASFWNTLRGEEPECLLVFGGGMGDEMFQPGSFQFNTQLSGISSSFSVLMDDYPTFVIPKEIGASASGGAVGGGGTVSTSNNKLPDFIDANGFFTVQIMMFNPADVPANPEQYSKVLVGRITPQGKLFVRAKGEGSIEIGLTKSVNADGDTVFSFPFNIPGF